MRGFRQFLLLPAALSVACGCVPSDFPPRDVATPVAPTAPAAPGAPVAPVATAPAAPAAGGVKYVPHESEERFTAYLQTLSDEEQLNLRAEQVYAVMGEPTRREPPIVGNRNGQTITVEEVEWHVPGSGIRSETGFVNGVASGMVIGIKD